MVRVFRDTQTLRASGPCFDPSSDVVITLIAAEAQARALYNGDA